MDPENEIYAFQHFGFSATQVSIERKHLMQSLSDQAIESLIKKLTPSPSPNTVDLLKQLKTDIANKMLDAVKTDLDELAALDNKNFTIPDHVLLATDFDHQKSYTAEQFKEVQQEIERKKQLFLENSVMIKSLEQQEENFELMKPCLDKYLNIIEKTKAAIALLQPNKLSNVYKLAYATNQVASKLCTKDNEDDSNKAK